MKKLNLVMAAAALSVSVAACGGGGAKLNKEEQKVADNIAAYIKESSQGQLTTKNTQCFGDSFVASTSIKRLEKAKLIKASGEVNRTAVSFDKDLADKFAGAYFKCIDYAEEQAKQVNKAAPVTDVKKLEDCIRKGVPEAEAKKLVVSTLLKKPDQKLAQTNYEKVTACQKKFSKK